FSVGHEGASARVPRHLEAAVFGREGVDRGHDREVMVDPEVDVGGRVLVRSETRATGQLEVDLVLEQDHWLTGAFGEQPEEARAREQRRQALVIRYEVLDARQHLR